MPEDSRPVGRLSRAFPPAPRPLPTFAVWTFGVISAVLLLDFLIDSPVATPVELLQVVVFGLACLALPLGARFPAAAVLLFLPGSVVAAVATGRIGIVTVMACVLLAVIATVGEIRGVVIALGVLTCWATAVSLVVYGDLSHLGPYAVFAVPAVLIGLAFGRVRLRSDRTERHNRELLSRQEQVRVRERESLARDLHDVVAHQLTVIALISGTRARSSDPEKLKAGLVEISQLSGEALTELRTLLRVLREAPDAAATPDSPRRSLSEMGLREGLDHLVQRLVDLGFTVNLSFDDDVDVTPARSTVESALRILQEATTNVIKYAVPGSRVVVRVDLSATSLSLSVESETAPGPTRRRVDPALTSGQGVLGMRERAALLGGQATIGPVGQTWTVRVALPTH